MISALVIINSVGAFIYLFRFWMMEGKTEDGIGALIYISILILLSIIKGNQ